MAESQPTRKARTCSIEGCDKALRARGWCSTHYYRWQVHGDPHIGAKIKYEHDGTCNIDGCDGKVRGRGWCHKHWKRWRAHGDPNHVHVREEKFRPCSVEDCDKSNHAHGLCASHYYHKQKYGDPLAEGPGKCSGRKRLETLGYESLHKRIFYDRGKAADHQCVDCNGQAQEWSYDGGCPDELTDTVQNGSVLAYSMDTSRYSPRCKKCHRRMDDSLIRERNELGQFAS